MEPEVTREIFWNVPAGSRAVFYTLSTLATGIFVYGFYRRYRLWRVGNAGEKFDNVCWPVANINLEEQAEIVEGVTSRYGRLDLHRIAYPRVRPKKTEAPAASLSPAERLKLLKSGGRQEEKKVERLRGEPDRVAQQLVQFLADKGFV